MNSPKRFSAAGLLLALAAAPLAQAIELPGPLVTADWLAQHAAEVTVLDVRDDLDSFTKAPEFDTDKKTGKKTLSEFGGHVPGALLVDFAKLRSDRSIDGRTVKAMLPERAAFEAVIRAAGVAQDKPIVIVSPGQSAEDLDEAARTYWSLKYYGSDAIAILDGGVTGWIDAGREASTEAAPTKAGDWRATEERKALLADSNDVAKAAAAKVQLVDARPLPFYLGLQKKPVVSAAGHIEGAVSLPVDVVASASPRGARFYEPDQYRAVFHQLNVSEQAPSITYCNTGHLASGAWFVMSELLGNKQVRLYDGSMHEWTLEGHPVIGLK